ncbi:hypothetical protein ACWGTI_04270 [Mesorhizobium sp. ArgA1]
MAHDLNLISIRYREVEQQIARHRDEIAKLESELPELDIAGRVIARLSGAEWPPAGAADEPKPENAASAKPDGLPTMPEMILVVMANSYRQGRRGMEPKDVTKAISERYWSDLKGSTSVSTTMWRMAQPKDGRLLKDDDSPLYMLASEPLPFNEKPADPVSEGEQSAGLSQPSAQGGEPGREVEHDNMNF